MTNSFALAVRGLRRTLAIGCLSALLLPLTGCMYPDEQTPGNDASARQSVLAVQDAVDRYMTDNGVLPIVSADESVPKYEKFKLDLGKLKRMNYLGSVPNVAFESGGRNQFLVIDEETKPTVKLLDIPVYQEAAAVQRKVNDYMNEHSGGKPVGEELYPGYWSLDFKMLGGGEPDARSMFSGQSLTFMLDAAGTVWLDYGLDIATAIRKSSSAPSGDEDLRGILVAESYFVPVKSPVYHWVNGEPVAQPEAG
ncbi:hypothetical protein [Cohnella lubricantis]|uniref:DUF3939 domain-containing protein n=1 Tax=Cohnella lubricantis TaxID=2163172 RepID=A0A841TFL1_9BACL|nr:hypothetical protein [Cohnella lubricantis]MBB6677737.1 hypothetical protein [Cohnella lubricantis]MBP2117699.1 hypothetical protein [Cohnella lubricantis]